MSTTHDQIYAAIRERKEIAERAGARCGEWYATFYSPMDEWRVRDRVSAGQIVEVIADDPHAEKITDHIASNSPDRILRDCERDLRVVERHKARKPYPNATYCDWCREASDAFSEVDWPCVEITDLAEAYGINLDGSGE